MAKSPRELRQENETLTKLVDMLRDKITSIEETSRMIGHTKSAIVDHGGHSLCRVSIAGGPDIIATVTAEFMESIGNNLPLGSNVMLLNHTVIAVIPDELEVKKTIPTFKLATWDDIGGQDEAVEKIRNAIELPLQNPEMFAEMNVEPLKGILLYGKPGNGKTLIAKAIASSILGSDEVEADAFIYVKGAELLSRFVGNAEQSIISIFKRCRNFTERTGKRATIFFDEADALMPKRGKSISSDVSSTIVPTFLSEMDGFDINPPLIILATNLPSSLDGAIIREGRIDLHVGINAPTKDGFNDIISVHLSKTKCVTDPVILATFATDQVFNNMPNRVSGAFAEAVVKMAASSSIKRKVNGNGSTELGLIENDITASLELLTV
tara:strand:+ start:4017 stop:5159 length:1143 start_codon:yes stop_codon:yes gene_type:complete